jgi:hypothetical protein
MTNDAEASNFAATVRAETVNPARVAIIASRIVKAYQYAARHKHTLAEIDFDRKSLPVSNEEVYAAIDLLRQIKEKSKLCIPGKNPGTWDNAPAHLIGRQISLEDNPGYVVRVVRIHDVYSPAKNQLDQFVHEIDKSLDSYGLQNTVKGKTGAAVTG